MTRIFSQALSRRAEPCPGSASLSRTAPCRLNDGNSRGKVQNVLCQEERASFGAPCCTRDEGRSFGAGMPVQASSHPERLWSTATVVSVWGKGACHASGMDQEGER